MITLFFIRKAELRKPNQGCTYASDFGNICIHKTSIKLRAYVDVIFNVHGYQKWSLFEKIQCYASCMIL